MSTFSEIEKAVEELSSEQFSELLRRMQERDSENWDREMKGDAESGQIDALYAKLEQENAGEPELPLDDFLDQGKLPKAV